MSSIQTEFIDKIICNYEKFIYYNDHNNIKLTSNVGYLYIFNCDFFDLINILKFGETIRELKIRLDSYPKKEINMRNIYAICCTVPDKRESLMKKYIKLKLTYASIKGTEYYSNECFEFFKLLILIIASLPEEDIINYHNNLEDNNNIIINKITSLINILKTHSNFNNITILIKNDEFITDNKTYSCEFCNKSFSSTSNLNTHLKTNKKCIEIRLKNSNKEDIKIECFECEFCKKIFSKKYNLNTHLKTCKIKTFIQEESPLQNKDINLEDENDTLKKEIKVLKEKQLKHEYELSLKDEQLKYALKSLEKKEQEYIILLNLLKKGN